MADGQQIAEALRQQFPQAVVGGGSFNDQHWVELRAEDLVEVARWLRDDEQAAFDHLVDVTAVHWPDEGKPFEMVYHLFSYTRNDRLRLKVRLDDGQSLASLGQLWQSALWNERETFDMFGIRFDGHPDLRRILMPDDYTDFPLRKEFPLYRG